MSPRPSPEQQARNARVDRMVALFMDGHSLDGVCEQGVQGGWTRNDVLTLVRQRGWPLDPSGRIPFRMRPRRPLPAQRRLPPAVLPPPLPRADVAAVAEPAAQPDANTQSARGRDRTRRDAATDAVDRFLADCTVQAPLDRFLTGGELRAAYDTWRAWNDAPELTAKQLGMVLTARYPRRQRKIGGAKPVCYFGIAWKEPAEPDPPLADWERELLKEVPGHPGQWASYAPTEEPVGPPVTVTACGITEGTPPELVRALADMAEAAARSELLIEASDPVEKPATPPVDVLAVGLAHPHPVVRAAAQRVLRAVDGLCTALARHRDAQGSP